MRPCLHRHFLRVEKQPFPKRRFRTRKHRDSISAPRLVIPLPGANVAAGPLPAVKVGPRCGFGKNHPRLRPAVFSPKTLRREPLRGHARASGNDKPFPERIMMKTDKKKRLLRRIITLATLALLFAYLHSHAIPPVAAVLAIICGRGLLRYMLAVASLLLTAAFIFVILGFIIY